MSATSSVLVATSLRPPTGLGPDRIIRLGSEAGFEGIAADDSLSQEELETLAAAGLRGGLPVSLAALPLAEATLPKGKRLPHLAAFDDPEERRAAVRRSKDTLAFGQKLGIPRFTVELGGVALRSPEAPLRLGYARREMERDEPGDKALRRALEERKAYGQALFDVLRASLEPLLAEAGRRGSTLLLRLATGPWQAPTPREAQLLLREFSGAPLALVYAPAGGVVRAELGLAGPREIGDERRAELARASQVVELLDRVGLDTGLVFGTGELVLDLPAELSADATWVVGGPLDASFGEVLRARKRASELRSARTATAAKARDDQGPPLRR